MKQYRGFDCFLHPITSQVLVISLYLLLAAGLGSGQAAAPDSGGTNYKLSGTLPPFGDVEIGIKAPQISPDGQYVVFAADYSTDNAVELYSVPLDGSQAPSRISGLLPAHSLHEFQIAPDSSRVVYQADQSVDERIELYSVPVSGGDVTRLNGDLVDGGKVQDFAFSPDGSRILYRADQILDETIELFSVPVGGGQAIKLNGPMTNGGNGGDVARGPAFTPNGSQVVYRADQQADEVYELYLVPATGGAVTKINGSLVSDGDVRENFIISPDSSRVVYVADQEVDDMWEMYATIIDAVPSGENVVYLPLVSR